MVFNPRSGLVISNVSNISNIKKCQSKNYQSLKDLLKDSFFIKFSRFSEREEVDFTIGRNWEKVNYQQKWIPEHLNSIVVTSSPNAKEETMLIIGGRGRERNYLHARNPMKTYVSSDIYESKDNAKSWKCITFKAEFPGRSDYTAFYEPLENKIYLIGGWDENKEYLNDIWISEDKGHSWTLQLAKAPFPGRLTHAACSTVRIRNKRTEETRHFSNLKFEKDFKKFHNYKLKAEEEFYSTIFIAGGFGGNEIYLNDVWISEDSGKSWTKQTSKAEWNPRYSHSLQVDNVTGNLVVIGGGGEKDICFSDIWTSSDLGKTWIKQSERNFPSRYYHSGVQCPDDSFLVVGGLHSDAKGKEICLNDIWKSTNLGKTWQRIRTPQRYREEIYFNSFTHSYSRALVEPIFRPRYAHGAVFTKEGNLYLVGGEDNQGQCLQDVWKSKLPLQETVEYSKYLLEKGKELNEDFNLSNDIFENNIMPLLLPSWFT